MDHSRLSKDAQAAVVARDQFSFIASRELRTPRPPLMLQIHMLERKVSEVAKDDDTAQTSVGMPRAGTEE